MKVVSVLPVTVTAKSTAGELQTVSFSSSQVAFLGFVADPGLESIRISSPFIPQQIPIVNVGNISYASELALDVTAVPTLSGVGLFLLTAGLLMAGWKSLRSRL